jgi:hypothetical protein
MAQVKGSGSVNGASGYDFILTATDGDLAGGGGSDRFRMRIVGPNGVVYDNTPAGGSSPQDSNPQAIGGGSITIHSR